MKCTKYTYLKVIMISVLAVVFITMSAGAETAAQIDHDVDGAIETLYAGSPAARDLSKTAKGILVFPNVIKAGLLVGAQYGQGALRTVNKTIGYYNTVAASYGLQAGAQSFGYAMFFMTENVLSYLKNSSGWEIGVGPSIVVVDEGVAKSMTTTTAKEDIYVFFFNQKGLMAGMGLQGSKITKIQPDK